MAQSRWDATNVLNFNNFVNITATIGHILPFFPSSPFQENSETWAGSSLYTPTFVTALNSRNKQSIGRDHTIKVWQTLPSFPEGKSPCQKLHRISCRTPHFPKSRCRAERTMQQELKPLAGTATAPQDSNSQGLHLHYTKLGVKVTFL